jgi:hypothetical protein
MGSPTIVKQNHGVAMFLPRSGFCEKTRLNVEVYNPNLSVVLDD